MTQSTEKEEFLVHERSESAWPGKTVKRRLWFEVLHGGDSGIRVSIPLRDKSYTDKTERRLSELEDGNIVEAVLWRKDSSDQWKPKEPPTVVSKL